MIPPATLLPSVLPTDRLTATGLAVPQLRADLRRISSARNAVTVAFAFVQAFGLLVAVDQVVERTGWWWLWVPAFVLQGRAHALFGILSHEGTHRLLFATQRWNDLISNWFIAPFSFSSQEGYRRSHMAHHRDPLGPNEPDKTLYADYPVTSASLRRRLRRDITGESGWKILKSIVRSLFKPVTRFATIRIICAQIILAVVLGFSVAWWAWFLMWFLPWMTVWRVINRLRAIAEHGGMVNSKDERLTTLHVRQSLAARFWMVPYNTGWHIAHHVDAGIPWRNLPRFHAELVRAGYIVDGLEYPSYRSLWRALSSRPANASFGSRQEHQRT
jgi:fatty acid desaturase